MILTSVWSIDNGNSYVGIEMKHHKTSEEKQHTQKTEAAATD